MKIHTKISVFKNMSALRLLAKNILLVAACVGALSAAPAAFGASTTTETALTITTVATMVSTQQQAFSTNLAVRGGIPGYSWSLMSGALPAGVTLSKTGTLSGTPTAPGNFNFKVKVVDSNNPQRSTNQQFQLTVELASVNGLPAGSVFTPPPANSCISNYDRYYAAEPGVYAYWAFCDGATPGQFHDYVGTWDLTTAGQAWGSGTVYGGGAGPVSDGETSAYVSDSTGGRTNQGIPMNAHEGTVATWISADTAGFGYQFQPVLFKAIAKDSEVGLTLTKESQNFCIQAFLTTSANTTVKASDCSISAGQFYRVAETWNNGVLTLYVNGTAAATANYAGSLDTGVTFYYRFFPGFGGVNTKISLAKSVVSNQAWTAAQATSDAHPTLPSLPKGGIYVTNQQLGTVHTAVLGYADNNSNLSTSVGVSGLTTGLAAAGVKAVRYANSEGGISADLEDWRNGNMCGTKPGAPEQPPLHPETDNNLDNYMKDVVQPLNLQTVFTVNYGTNPPYCDAGGDPNENGADLVSYANVQHNYGIKRWEIGNEQYSSNTETDFHPNPTTGASYAKYEPAFYKAMKAVDPTIQIGVPVSMTNYGYATNFTLPVLAGASYDAVIFHNYPVLDPVTDGGTIYPDRVASNMRRTRGELLTLQTALLNQAKDPSAIWITEWSGEVGGFEWSRQTMGVAEPLFAAMELGEYMRAGVETATWWEQGRTDICSTLNYDGQGDTAYSWWECGNTALAYTGAVTGSDEAPIGLEAGEPTPVGRAFQVLSESGFVTEGEHMLETDTDMQNSPWLASYAATHGSGTALLLINRDRDNAHTVPVRFAGMTSGTAPQQWIYGRAQYDSSRTSNWSVAPMHKTLKNWGEELLVTLPAWSVSVVIIP